MLEPIRTLIVEDTEDDTALLLRELRRGGYDVTFERVDTAVAMQAAIARQEWDVVISDYSMPHLSGPEALKVLRAAHSEVPFILLSGTIGEETAVAALTAGAQDYIMKGNLKRLVPAIQREMREVQRRKEHQRLELHVRRLETFEVIGRLAGGIAHDFNNALSVIIGWSQLGFEEAPLGNLAEIQERFRTIREEARHSAGLTAQLLAFSRQQVLQPTDFDLNELVAQTSGMLQSALGDQIEFKTNLATGPCSISADVTQIRQVLMNLCLNARDAMADGGRLTVETRNVEIGEAFCLAHDYGRPGAYVVLVISDSGIGMDAATVEHIFEPFFTTKEMGRGTGLGLATVYGIIKQHDGFVNVYSEPSHGTTLRVYIPASYKTPEALNATAVDPPQGGSETILVAEDYAALLELASEILGARGYRVMLASNGKEAVQIFKTSHDRIDLVLLDVTMPFLSGPDAYAQMHSLNPDVPVIFTTGHTTESASLGPYLEKGATLLQKPYDPQALGRAVRSRLDSTLCKP